MPAGSSVLAALLQPSLRVRRGERSALELVDPGAEFPDFGVDVFTARQRCVDPSVAAKSVRNPSFTGTT
jgi:hypothetical protein